MKQQFLYRYELTYHCGTTTIYLVKFLIVKKTPCGFTIELPYNKTKWVSGEARSSYAQTSEREALKHFVRRKTYRNHCINDELERNEIAIKQAKDQIKREDDKQRKK